MAIVDVLTQHGVEANKFTVDTSGVVNFVGLTAPILGALSKDSLFPRPRFQKGDHFILLGFGYHIPYNFVAAQEGTGATFRDVQLEIKAEKQSDHTFQSLTIIDSTLLYCPLENTEISFGAFQNVNFINDQFQIVAGFNHMKISMVGVNSMLNTEVINIPIFIKVLHNLPLETWTP